jgi:hypothetical protein
MNLDYQYHGLGADVLLDLLLGAVKPEIHTNQSASSGTAD